MTPEPSVVRGEAGGLRFDLLLDPQVPRAVVAALAAYDLGAPVREPADVVWRVGRSSRPAGAGWSVDFGDGTVWSRPLVSELLDGIVHMITQRVLASDRDLRVHAAAVAIRGLGLVLPAGSGSGKSTLTAALVRSAAAYLTDESVGFGPDGVLHGYAKPIGLKHGSRAALPDVDWGVADLDAAQSVWHFAPDALGGRATPSAPVAALVFPRFVAGAGVAFHPLARASAVARVLGCAQNLRAAGLAESVGRVAAVVARTEPVVLEFDDAVAAARQIALRTAPRPEPVRFQVVAAPESGGSAGREARPAAGVVAACFADGAILVHGASLEMLTTGPVGAAIWPRLGSAPLDALIHDLAGDFGVTERAVRAALVPWLDDLRSRGFVA